MDPALDRRGDAPAADVVIEIRRDEIVVETRCRREVNGAWEPDARWLAGPGKDPLPRYVIGR